MKNDLNVFTLFGYIDKEIYLSKLYNSLKKIGVGAYDMSNPLMMFKSKIIHLHWIEYYISSESFFKTALKTLFFPLFFLFLKYILRKKIVISPHNIEPQKKSFPFIEKLGFKFYLSFVADRVIFFNDWQGEELAKRYGISSKKLRQTDLISFIGSYSNTISKLEARKGLDIDKGRLVILMFGRLEEYKGIYDLIDFLRKEKKRDYVVIFAGEPGTEDIKNKILGLEKNQKGNLLFKTGYFSDKDIQILMNASDFGILPYNVLANSGVLLLFGAFKKSMIVKESRSFREILGKSGLYYKSDGELKKIINNVTSKKAKRMGKDFYDKIKMITYENIAKDTLKIYKELL